MKCLTIHQPYAHLIATGVKLVENRSWPTRHRELLAIHAAKTTTRVTPADEEAYPNMAFSAIVAVAWLSACIHKDRIPQRVESQPELEWLLDHPHVEGPYCWILARVWRLREPIPLRGQQGLYELPLPIERRLRGEAITPPHRPT